MSDDIEKELRSGVGGGDASDAAARRFAADCRGDCQPGDADSCRQSEYTSTDRQLCLPSSFHQPRPSL